MEEVNSKHNRMDHLEELQFASSKQFQEKIYLKESETLKQQRSLNEVIDGMNVTIPEIKHGMATVKSLFKDVMDSAKSLKEKLSSSADAGVECTIVQLTSTCTKIKDMMTEYEKGITQSKHNENKWSHDWSAQEDLIASINENEKEIERIQDEINQSEKQFLKDCTDFKTGTWRDDTAGTESLVSNDQRRQSKYSAECELITVKTVERIIREERIYRWQIADPRARDEYVSIMDERAKIVEECKEVVKHCVNTGVNHLRYGKYLGGLKELETELRERSNDMLKRYIQAPQPSEQQKAIAH